MKYRYNILSNKDKEYISNSYFSANNITKDFSLSKEELIKVNKFNKKVLSFGYAVQYLFLKNRGLSINADIVPVKILDFIASQLNFDYMYFKKYITNKNARSNHFKEIMLELGYRKFNYTDEIIRVAYNLTLTTSNGLELIERFILYLRKEKIIIPALSKMEEVISKALTDSNQFIYSKIFKQIEKPELLDKLFLIEDSGTSTYSRFKKFRVNNSPNGVKLLLSYIQEIDELSNIIDLSFLSDSKINCLYNEIQKNNKHKIEKIIDKKKKYATLAMFIYFKRKELVDMVIEVTSNYAHKVMRKSKKKSHAYNLKSLKKHKMNSHKLKDIIKNIFDIEDFESFKTYKTSLISLKNELDSQEEDLQEIDFLIKAQRNFNYTNKLLECIKFDSNTKPEFIKCLNEFPKFKGKKTVKIDISFFSKQWQNIIQNNDYSKKVLEVAILYSIRDYIRSGDIFVRESRKYNSFDHYLIETPKEYDYSELNEILMELKNELSILKKLNFNTKIKTDNSSSLSNRIYSFFPKVTMTDILYEVNSWTNVLEEFRNLDYETSKKQKELVATLLANGHNIEFSKMAISSNINETSLRRLSEIYFNHDLLYKAQKTLVNYHHSLDIVGNWGEGKTSSSDGMRVPITLKTIYADYNTHYGNKGGAMYRHVTDQYTPYYIQMLEGRDSNHVLDGLLYHGTNLDISDHSTDTAGYTEQMFALTYLLGFNFKPRIKNLEQQQLYAFENIQIGDKKFKKINKKVILDNLSEINRLVESIKCGKVKASLILQKIGSYARDNGIAKGLKEIGRILKTKYIINYYTDENLRKEVQKILNKGEAINSIGRLIFFGKHGRLNKASLEEQLATASCLNILLSSLIIWNSRYLEKVYKLVKEEEWFDEEEFKRVSPLGTQHVNFLGKYIFKEEKIDTEDGLREIEKESQII